MKAITVLPGTPASVQLDDRPEPQAGPDTLLVQAVALGVCGTDREIISGAYGWAPPGKDRLVLGHESLGRVEALLQSLINPVDSGSAINAAMGP